MSLFEDGENKSVSVGPETVRPRQSVRELQKMATVGALADGLCHRLNNLLQSVLSAAFYLKPVVEACGDPVALEELEKIRSAAREGGSLGKQLLTLTREDTGPLRAVALNREVRSILPLLQAAVPGSWSVEAELASDLPPALADALRVRLLLIELVLSFRAVLPGGGAVWVETGTGLWEAVEWDTSFIAEEGPCLLLRVSCRGGEVPLAEPQRLREFLCWEPLETAVGEAERSPVLHAIECLGGAIAVDRSPEEGVRVTIGLPLCGAEHDLSVETEMEGFLRQRKFPGLGEIP